jgi:hypothetical protein
VGFPFRHPLEYYLPEDMPPGENDGYQNGEWLVLMNDNIATGKRGITNKSLEMMR